MAGNKKKEIITIAQENLHMLKRLTEKTSCYNFQRWEKEYEKAQYYKRSHCVYPSIDFYKTQRAETFGNKYYNSMTSGWYNNTKTNYGSFQNNKKKFEDFNYKEFETTSNKNNSRSKTLEAEKKENNEEQKENKETRENKENEEAVEKTDENKENRKFEENNGNNEKKENQKIEEKNKNKEIGENNEVKMEDKEIGQNKENEEKSEKNNN